jgi:hypothetical protein
VDGNEGGGVTPGWVRIPCQHAHRLLSERIDRSLGFGDRVRLRLHLTVCDVCTRVDRQLSLLRAATRRIGK